MNSNRIAKQALELNIFDKIFQYTEKDISKFWTPIPYIIFRYVMDDTGGWHHVSEFKPFDGYTVQGAAWSNGFYYIVSNKDFLLEANLFVDIHTKEQYNYAS